MSWVVDCLREAGVSMSKPVKEELKMLPFDSEDSVELEMLCEE